MIIRCAGRVHGDLIPDGDGFVYEVKCRSERCGARSGVVILHRYRIDIADGEATIKELATTRFRDPKPSKERQPVRR